MVVETAAPAADATVMLEKQPAVFLGKPPLLKEVIQCRARIFALPQLARKRFALTVSARCLALAAASNVASCHSRV